MAINILGDEEEEPRTKNTPPSKTFIQVCWRQRRREAVNFYKISNEEIIVIYDDISLEVGRLRIREKGSHGGHNGIKSIIANLSSDVFPRVKIGVGGPKGDLVSHVLGKFSNSEIEILRESIMATSEAVTTILSKDTKEAMNKFNGFKASAISD